MSITIRLQAADLRRFIKVLIITILNRKIRIQTQVVAIIQMNIQTKNITKINTKTYNTQTVSIDSIIHHQA